MSGTLAGVTVENTASSISYNGNGVTTAFPTTFRFLEDTDLSVTKTVAGVTTALVLGVDYTVDGAGDVEPGGTVNMIAAPAAGATLTIERNTPITQENAFRQLGRFSPETWELTVDKLTLIAQEDRRKIEALEALSSLLDITGLGAAAGTKDFATDANSVEATFPFNIAVAKGDTATDAWVTRLENRDNAAEVFDECPAMQWSPGGAANTISVKRIDGLKPGTNYRVRVIILAP